jgi:hypothetical protein
VIKFTKLRYAGHTARMEEGMSAFKKLKGKPRGKRPLGSSGSRWKDNIIRDLKRIGDIQGIVLIWQGIGIIRALAKAALNLRVS